jgi:hypothetical protein
LNVHCCLCKGVIGGSAVYVSVGDSGQKPAHISCATRPGLAASVPGLVVQS